MSGGSARSPHSLRHADAEIGGIEMEVGFERRGSIVENDFAAAHDVASLGYGKGAFGVLLDQEDGDAFGADGAEEVVDLVDDCWREAEGRLVEHQEPWAGDECPGDRELLLLPAR